MAVVRPIMFRKSLFTLSIVLSLSAMAQEELGIANSNYAGVNGLHLNPSSIVDSWAKLDIHLVGASVFFENNYVYLPKNEFSLWQNVDMSPGENNSTTIPDLQTNENEVLKHGTVDASVQGPSFMWAGKRGSFALSSRVRSHTNINNVSPELAKLIFEGFQYAPNQGTDLTEQRFRVNSMTWGELGFTYGHVLFKQNKNFLTGAVGVRRLIGINAMSIAVENIDYEVHNDSLLEIRDINGHVGLGDVEFNSGGGWGGDIGFTYKRMKEDASDYYPHSRSHNCNHLDYRYKIGVSLLDVGTIKFTDAQYGSMQNSSSYWSGYDTTIVEAIGDVDSLLAARFSNYERGTEFKSRLPMAISLQYDHSLGKNFFLNLTAVQSLNGVKSIGLRRSSIIGLTPRYEIKRFEVAVPMSLYEYQRPRVGLAFRFNSLVIGTDNLLPLVGQGNVYGADIYFSFKYTIFKSGVCNGKRGRKGKRKQKDFVATDQALPCPID